ncbi:MAG: NUDIX domain-containing protein [Clostridiales bacterium]|nr:NUDIX domain-containing protein [Clostridiales bacterium]
MADYILDLRKTVGHRCLLQVGASVIVEDRQGRILLERRTDNGLWGYPGGGTELDERVEDAARRELFEETGLTAGEMTLFGVFSGPETHYVYPNGDEVSNVDVVFLCRECSGEIVPQREEVREIRFFSAADMPPCEQWSPPIRPALRQWRDGKLNG